MDGLGRELTTAKTLVNSTRLPDQSKENVGDATEDLAKTIDRAIQPTRTMSYFPHPVVLDEVGLLLTARSCLEGMTKRSGIENCPDLEPEEVSRLRERLKPRYSALSGRR
jgi:signal transduction histidine kinase